MKGEELEQRIRTEIRPGHSRILKCNGHDRRDVTSNNGHTIGMRTGKTKKQSKAIQYEMIKYAFERLNETGRFDLEDFCRKFKDKRDAAPCRYSMTGGILVALGIADSRTKKNSCYYIKTE